MPDFRQVHVINDECPWHLASPTIVGLRQLYALGELDFTVQRCGRCVVEINAGDQDIFEETAMVIDSDDDWLVRICFDAVVD